MPSYASLEENKINGSYCKDKQAFSTSTNLLLLIYFEINIVVFVTACYSCMTIKEMLEQWQI